MKTRILAVMGIILFGSLLLFGCTSEQTTRLNGTYSLVEYRGDDALVEYNYQLTNGSMVTCIVFTGMYKGGVSCDWEHIRT